jgi:DNA-binding GntR family transcriptional regulator
MLYPDVMDRSVTAHRARPAPSRTGRRAAASRAPGARSSRSQKNWEKAYDEIKALILSLGVKPGETLSENPLARRLGISRTPVREALKALEREGLVVSEHGRKRAFVLSIRDVEEIFDMKIALEGRVARWAAERGSAADRAALARVARRMRALADRAPQSGSARDEWHGRWLATDEEYHTLLFRMAANRRAEDCIRVLNSLWHRLRLGMITVEGRIGRSTGEHDRIAHAVAAGNAAEAGRLMEEHLRRLKEMLMGVMAAFHYPSVDTGNGKS